MPHIPPPGGGAPPTPRIGGNQRPITVGRQPRTDGKKAIAISLPFFFSEEKNSDVELTRPGGGRFLVRGREISNRVDVDTASGNQSFQSEITGIRVTVGNDPNSPHEIEVPNGADCKVEIFFDHP